MLITPGTSIVNAVNPVPDAQGFPAMGTIGGIVYDDEGKELLLTCYHCVFNLDLKWREFIPAPNNTLTLSGNNEKIGRIIKAYRTELVDIALIDPFPDHTINAEIPGIGKILTRRILADAEKGTVRLRKYGWATQYTTGEFIGISPSTGGDYYGDSSKHFLSDLIQIGGNAGPFSISGDSGSFIVDANNAVVGMVVMADGNIVYGIPVQAIENKFNITFIKPKK